METPHRKNAARATFAKKKLAVMEAVGHKVAYDAQHYSGYGYATEAVVFEHLRRAMIDAGLVFGFSVESIEYELTGQKIGKNNVPEVAAMIVCRCWLTDAETGFLEEGSVPGSSADTDRKAPWQAIPGCVKYWIARQFMVATGDDPEALPAPKVSKVKRKVSKKEAPTQSRNGSIGHLKNQLLKKTGGFKQALDLAGAEFGVTSLDELDEAQLETLISIS